MLYGLPQPGAHMLPPGAHQLMQRTAGANFGAGGTALLNAVMAHRQQQHAAATYEHPHTVPVSYPVAAGNGLMAAQMHRRPRRVPGIMRAPAPPAGGPGGALQALLGRGGY